MEVKCFGQKRRSQVKDKETSPVWDENLFIIQKDVDMDQLDRSQVHTHTHTHTHTRARAIHLSHLSTSPHTFPHLPTSPHISPFI